MKIEIKQWVSYLAYLLFFMMLFAPTIYTVEKIILLSIIFPSIIIGICKSKKIRLHPKIAAWSLGLVILNMAFVVYGVFNGNPGAVRVSTVAILWPILYTFFLSAINEKIIYNLVKVMQLSTIMISIYSILFILYAMGIWPSYLFISLYEEQNVELASTRIEYTVRSLSSLMFLVPFNIATLMSWPSKNNMPIKRKWIVTGSILALSAIFLSGRRALLLVFLLAPLFALVFQYFLPAIQRALVRRVVWRTLMGCLIIAIFSIAAFGNQISNFADEIAALFMEGFDFDHDSSASLRKAQFYVLLHEWSDSPFFGAGHGASAAGIIRSEKMTWAYELSYLALLYHIGIVGLLIHALAIVWIIYNGIKIIRTGSNLGFIAIPTLTGMCCFLVANATNPYLLKYDYLWTIFFPIAIINQYMITRKPISTGGRDVQQS